MKSKAIKIGKKQLTFFGHEDQYLDHLALGGEANFDEFAKDQVPQNANIFDIGANIGFVSALFSVRNPDANIYAIEPGFDNYNFLKKNIEVNNLKNVYPLNVAASFENSIGSFNEHSAWGYLDSVENNSTGHHQVEVTTIDSLILKLGLKKIDLIKVDVEGFELQVFEGMSDTIKIYSPKIIVEFNTFCMLSYGRRNPLDFLQYLDETFTNIMRFAHRNTGEPLLVPVNRENFAVSQLHENIVLHGSVDDFLVWN